MLRLEVLLFFLYIFTGESLHELSYFKHSNEDKKLTFNVSTCKILLYLKNYLKLKSYLKLSVSD